MTNFRNGDLVSIQGTVESASAHSAEIVINVGGDDFQKVCVANRLVTLVRPLLKPGDIVSRTDFYDKATYLVIGVRKDRAWVESSTGYQTLPTANLVVVERGNG